MNNFIPIPSSVFTNKWITMMSLYRFEQTIKQMTKEQFNIWLIDLDIVADVSNSNMISVWLGMYFRAKGQD
jgi:hypothetical protein